MEKIKLIGMLLCLWIEQAFALGVTPARMEARIMPGESAQGSFQVTNNLNEPVRINLSTKDWFILPANQGLNVDKWLRLDSAEAIILEPGTSASVSYTITAPTQAVGALVGMVSFSEEKEVSTGIGLTISAAVYAIIAGTERVAGEITEFKLKKDGEALRAAVLVKNSGNVPLRPAGYVLIYNRKKEEVARIELKEGRPVYPEMIRSVLGETNLVLNPGKYKAEAHLTWWENEVVNSINLKVSKNGEIAVE